MQLPALQCKRHKPFVASLSCVAVLCGLHQISAPRAGNVTFSLGTLMTCPVGSNFIDNFGGLYGPASYPAVSSFCMGGGSILVSTLEFQCVVCPPGQYSLVGGSSNGSAGSADNSPCQSCPVGGVCNGGAPAAAPGFWGAASHVSPRPHDALFAVCPAGYCCDGSELWPCVGMNPCSGHRGGPLCGDCKPGFVVPVGSAYCVPWTTCASDKPLLWVAIAAGELVSAVLQLTVVSGTWMLNPSAPDGKMKLVIYFAQVRCSFEKSLRLRVPGRLPLQVASCSGFAYRDIELALSCPCRCRRT